MVSVRTKFPDQSLQFGGAPMPLWMPGRYKTPPGYGPSRSTSAFATTGARYYIAPWFIDKTVTLAGAWNFNGGAGDNGDKAKMALYSESTSGGPGARVKDFGEITYTGAAALRLHASAYTATPGQYYLEFVTDNAVTMNAMSPFAYLTAVGSSSVSFLMQMGWLAAPPTPVAEPNSATPMGDYKDGTYANFPEATSLTPTNTVIGLTDGTFPYFGLYT